MPSSVKRLNCLFRISLTLWRAEEKYFETVIKGQAILICLQNDHIHPEKLKQNVF